MFPTSGLFQEFSCPFYSDGLCNRPYCHFSHTKSGYLSASSDVDLSESSRDSSVTVNPVYKPTPITLLEKRNNSRTIVECETNETVIPSPPSSIPVYQPTPISELEKYAPAATFLRPSNPPTYSPVVRSSGNCIGPPSTPAQLTPFAYQPSPAYPPVTITSSTIDLTDTSTGSLSSPLKTEESELPSSKVSELENSVKIPSSERKLKRRQKPLRDGIAISSPSLENSDSNIPNTSSELDLEVESNESAALKRQKLLALYNDLYGDHPLSQNSSTDAQSPAKSKSSVPSATVISPYLGKIEATQKSPDDRRSVETASEVNSSENAVILLPRPRVPLRKSDKIPMPIRTRYLDQFIEECLLIYECPNDAYDRALHDEQSCHDKATSRMAYLNAVIQRLKSLKAEKLKVQEDGMRKPISAQYRVRSSLKNSGTTAVDVIKDDAALVEQRLDEAVRGPLLYEQLRKYILSDEQLIANGFPREDKSEGSVLCKAKLAVPDDKRAIYDVCQKNEYICCRCGARYKVDEFGNALVQQKCVYHWGRPVKQRVPGAGVDLRYVCCQGEVGQPGCQLCPSGHVHESNKWLDCEGFVTTLPPLILDQSDEDGPDERVNVYAVDCEMVYTTAGCELGRVTIVDSKLNTVLDSVVRPYNIVIDCNTRFSGLKREQLEQSETRITDIQSKLLHLFDSDTILVGHSLESDLLALKLIHGKVVDTSVMFPHRYGPPKKRALRNLACEILNRIIQQDDGGHNSLEDAVACMQLVQHRVKEDLRRGKWALK